MRKTISLLLKVGVSAGVVALIFTRVDFDAMLRSVRSIGAFSVMIAVGISFLQNILCAFRWMQIQRVVSRRIAFWPALRVNYAAGCLGQCLPSFVGGDAYRMYWLYQEGHGVAPAVRGVVLDRISAFLGLVFMLAAAVPWIVIRFDDTAALTAVSMLLAAGLGGAGLLFSGDALPAAARRWRPLAELATLAVTARRVLLSGTVGLRVVGLSMAVHALTAVAMFLFARDMGLPLFFLDCLAVVPLMMLIAAVPISIAGWGIREGVMVAALSLLGVQAAQAVVLSILLGCMALFTGLIGAIPWGFGPIRLSAVRLPDAPEPSSHSAP
jgi:uncharacterized membrane protein YbhN (UPF0104 family)